MKRQTLIEGLVRAALTLAFVVPLGGTGVAVAQEESTKSPEFVSVDGQVLSRNGIPIPNARVVLREWAIYRYSEDSFLQNVEDILAETKSDENGRFQFEKVATKPFKSFHDVAPWDLVVFAEGHGLAWAHLAQTPGEQPPLTIALGSEETIQGRIVDAEGLPIVGCEIEVADFGLPGSSPRGGQREPDRISLWRSQLRLTAKTDEHGDFILRSLPTDKRISLVVYHPRYERQVVYIGAGNRPQPTVIDESWSNGRSEKKEHPVYANGFTLTMKSGWLVRGKVVRADTAQPVPRAKLRLTTTNSAQWSRLADDEGRFEFGGLAEPDYDLVATGAEPGLLATRQTVRGDVDHPEQEATLPLESGVEVRGAVVDVDTGKGVANVPVAYEPPKPAGLGSAFNRTSGVTSDVNGQFTLFVPPGPGKIYVYSVEPHPTHYVPYPYDRGNNSHAAPEHSAEIDVQPGQPRANIKLKLGHGLVLRGQVLDVAGEPVAVTEIRVRTPRELNRQQQSTKTNADGRYEFTGLEDSGEYTIFASHNLRGINGATKLTVPAWKELTHVANVEPIRLQSSVTVSGRVLADGQPRAGVQMTLQTLKAIDKEPGSYTSELVEHAVTAADGTFTMLAPPGQDFNVAAYTEGFMEPSMRTMRGKPGERIEMPIIELQSRNTFVEGIVVDPDGNPVPGVTVTATSRRGRGGGGGRYGGGSAPNGTAADGRFRIDNLPNAPMEIMAYLRPAADNPDRSIRFPATALAMPGQRDVRVILDPKLKRSPPPLEPESK